MENMENQSTFFTLVDEDGNVTEYEILCTFTNEENGKDYIVYTDNSVDEEGNTRIMASVYIPEAEDINLFPIQTKEEWDAVEALIKQLQDEYGTEEE